MELGPALERLRRIGLQPFGQFSGPLVVVERTPGQFREAVLLDDVIEAVLDFDVEIPIEPPANNDPLDATGSERDYSRKQPTAVPSPVLQQLEMIKQFYP
jgi:hypothetical protein